MRFVYLIYIAFCFFSYQAYAQQENQTPSSKAASEILIADPTERQMKEAKSFLTHCRKNETMNKRHDCKCLSLRFLEKRVENGDETKTSELIQAINNECLNNSEAVDHNSKKTDIADIPEEILAEAELIHQQCKDSWDMRTYHDCDCIAGKFIDDRLNDGPFISADIILSRYQGVCKNPTELAGFQYTKCMDQHQFTVPREFKPKYYCECFASEYAKGYANLYERPTSDTSTALTSAAYSTCVKKLRKNEKYLRNIE